MRWTDLAVDLAGPWTPLRYVELGLALAGLAFVQGVLVYLGVSFLLMAAHVERRSRRAAAKAAFREAFWVLVTQPLLPFFYVVGRRLGGPARPRPGRVPVVFVHGYMQNRVDFLRMAWVMARRGAGPLYGFNYGWTRPIARSAQRLRTFVEAVRAESGAPRVDLVCHSMGGVVAMELLLEGGTDLVRRCVTIASPHGGIVYRGPVLGLGGEELRRGSAYWTKRAARSPIDSFAAKVGMLSIASSHDNIVHPVATSALTAVGGKDVVVEHLGHLSLLFDPAVISAVATFLSEEGS